MFQELLFALNGLPGSIFFESPDGIKVSCCIPNLHPAEISILQRLCDLGTNYKHLADFIKKHKFHFGTIESEIHGLYLQALCSGIEIILGPYQEELVQMGEEILGDPFLPLTYFLKLEKYMLLFQTLSDVVGEIMKDKVHGCRILDVLFQHSNSGVPFVEASMDKILQHCHIVMYRQMFCWIMNPYIEDPCNEFFIQPVKVSKNKISATGLPNTSEKDSHDVNYAVKPDLLPSYIPSNLAFKIYSTGLDVAALRAADDSDSYSLFIKKECIFSKKIEKLSSMSSFSLLRLTSTIDDIGQFASELLLQVIVKKANIVQHLKIIKDFYFLGRGELFSNFIIEANHQLKMPVTTTAECEISKIFQTITRNTTTDDDAITEKFHVTLNAYSKSGGNVDKESLSKAKLETGWSSITLFYDVPNPLHILITPSVIEKYNVIFRFLLSVKRVQIELHQCWAQQMQKKDASVDFRLTPFWNLRSHMSFLIDNFQYYILVDVLESCFSILSAKMGKVKDFEEVQMCHNNFVSNIISQCFLELWTVNHSLTEILEICSTFCGLLNRVYVSLSQKDLNQFDSLKLNFQRQTSLLFRTLSGVRSHQVSPFLSQLLVRIDYNNFLSSSGGQLGGTK